MGKKGKNFAIGTLLAAAVGYITGILTAPKSGKETRKDIHDAAGKAKKDAEKKLKELHSELDEQIDKAKERVSELTKTAKEELNTLVDKAQGAKQKARETLSSIHEGDESDDKELEKAVDDVNAAIANLRDYLDKKSSTK